MRRTAIRSTHEINKMIDAIQHELRRTPVGNAFGGNNLEDIKLLRKWKKCLSNMVNNSRIVACGCEACWWLMEENDDNPLNFLTRKQNPNMLPAWLNDVIEASRRREPPGLTSNNQ